MSTETAHQSRGGARRHTVLRPARRSSGRDRRLPRAEPEVIRPRAVYVTRRCPCGRLFKIQQTSPRMTCAPGYRGCTVPHSERATANAPHINAKYREWAENRKPYIREWKKRNRDWVNAQEKARRDRVLSEARAKRAFRERMYAKGWEPRSQANRADPLLELDPETRAEVIALLEEQRKDDRRYQAQFGPSLDERLDDSDTDDGSWTMARRGGVCFDREEDEWAYRAARGRGRKVRANAA